MGHKTVTPSLPRALRGKSTMLTLPSSLPDHRQSVIPNRFHIGVKNERQGRKERKRKRKRKERMGKEGKRKDGMGKENKRWERDRKEWGRKVKERKSNEKEGTK